MKRHELLIIWEAINHVIGSIPKEHNVIREDVLVERIITRCKTFGLSDVVTPDMVKRVLILSPLSLLDNCGIVVDVSH